MSFEFQNPQIETKKSDEKSSEFIKPLYRGIWADKLENTQELPVGGSMFDKKLSTKLKLDFEVFDSELKGFTEENLKNIYKQSEKNVIDWLKQIGSNDIDPYEYFLCYQVQQKINKLLEIDSRVPTNSFERQKMFMGEEAPKLSEMKGKSECAERAALAQYIFQKSGIHSSYVSGITMNNIKDEDEFPENHSFLVLDHFAKPKSTLIFDIARPISENNIPRVLETDVPFTYDKLKGEEDLLIGAKEILQNHKLWFGVGDQVAGYHKTIEESGIK